VHEHWPERVTVEVDLALRRPPAVHARVWVDVAVQPEWGRNLAEAEELACQVACATRPQVVMPVGARIVDWS
jgi:hypothetical protein